MRPALLLRALLLTGIQIPEPTEGVVVSKSSMGPYSVYGRREGCGYWEPCARLVRRMPGYHVVRYRWERLGRSGVSECYVPPGVYWRVEIDEPFRCDA